jgi:pyrimidine operon attenuation protein/uracil phosphoribosyltransferase
MNPQNKTNERQVLDARMFERSLRRIANQIVERNRGAENLLVVGIQTRGVNLAERLVGLITQIEGEVVPTGKLDITLYRDDLRHNPLQPTVRSTDLPADITGLNVVLVDDVFYTGRTVRAALDALVDFGRPASITLAVLIDRGHQELPIRADFTGAEINTRKDEDVVVRVAEVDGSDGVWIKTLG